MRRRCAAGCCVCSVVYRALACGDRCGTPSRVFRVYCRLSGSALGSLCRSVGALVGPLGRLSVAACAAYVGPQTPSPETADVARARPRDAPPLDPGPCPGPYSVSQVWLCQCVCSLWAQQNLGLGRSMILDRASTVDRRTPKLYIMHRYGIRAVFTVVNSPYLGSPLIICLWAFARAHARGVPRGRHRLMCEQPLGGANTGGLCTRVTCVTMEQACMHHRRPCAMARGVVYPCVGPWCWPMALGG